MKTMLILTGPQGSGNHMWAKIFALHSWVSGWSALLDQYWIGHDQEPWAEYWRNPDLLRHYNWGTHNYYVTSISTPYMYQGQLTTPDFRAFATGCQTAGLKVKFAVLGRDQSILTHQQDRVRQNNTLATAIQEFEQFATPYFLSYELVHLYGTKYLETVSQQLAFPIAVSDARIKDILAEDTNKKYVRQVRATVTDQLARRASGLN
jgi:hypothetical protein